MPCVGRPGLVCVERAVCIGGGIGGGDAARRLPSFSAAPTLSSPRSVINLASEILNLAPPAYRFFLFQVTLSNLPCTAKFAKVRILNLVIAQANNMASLFRTSAHFALSCSSTWRIRIFALQKALAQSRIFRKMALVRS